MNVILDDDLGLVVYILAGGNLFLFYRIKCNYMDEPHLILKFMLRSKMVEY